jgi:hypothetical protein
MPADIRGRRMSRISKAGASTSFSMVLLVASAAHAVSPAEKCEAAKLKIAGKYELCRLKAEATAAKTGAMRDFSKCDSAYSAKWAQTEMKAGGMCASNGDQATVQAFISQHTSALGVALAGAPLPACGNGVIDPGEQCDQSNLNSQTCASQGFAGGVLKCGPGCVFDTSGCSAIRYVDNGDGTVSDLQTGLMWEKKDNLDLAPNLSDPHDADNTYTWCVGDAGLNCIDVTNPPDGSAFTDFLAKLNNGASTDGGAMTPITGCFANHCDWRLPTIVELQGIADPTQGLCGGGLGACIDPAFGPTLESVYWSSTTDASEVIIAWKVLFDDALVFGIDEKATFGYVRAVRGGP